MILESNLIKRYKPHYNVLLKDDKSYPFPQTHQRSLSDAPLYPARVFKDGATYFGPYPNPGSVRKVQELVGSIFPLAPKQRRTHAKT